jgi:hypothetical protein
MHQKNKSKIDLFFCCRITTKHCIIIMYFLYFKKIFHFSKKNLTFYAGFVLIDSKLLIIESIKLHMEDRKW